MGIKKIEIENYKSIKKCTLLTKDINLLIGQNGSGKTNILSAIQYFYSNLVSVNDNQDIFDYNNKFSNNVIISLTFDLSELKKRSYSNLNHENSQYRNYYEKIISMSWDDEITITLSKIKGKEIRWSHSLNDRKLIYNLFPLYIVDSRSIDLTDWSNLWQQIGDLVKIENHLNGELKENIDKIVNNDKYKLSNTFKNLDDVFLDAKVKVRKFTPKQFASALSSLYYNGDEFEFKDGKLSNFSNGTNSFNYTSILIEVLSLIADKKMKSPIVLIDEPELSLHHKLIDELTSRILEYSSNIEFIISTHSPRFLKNILIKDEDNCCIFHIRLIDSYSIISKMKLFDEMDDARSRIFITDQHSNAYFAKVILNVEGDSEIEVFSNKYLHKLFPVLDQVDLVTGMSNGVINNIISPSERKYKTSIISLIDMDKVIFKAANENKMEINKKEKFFNHEAEKYYYTMRRYKTLNRKKRIYSMVDKCRFHYKLPFYSCSDPNFYELIALIKGYFKEYNIFVASTTLEGMLITRKNQDLFWKFAKECNKNKNEWMKIERIYESYKGKDKLNLLRLLYSGKTDYILTLKQLETHNKKIDKVLVKVIEKNSIQKTNGWMSKWLEYYFCTLLDIDCMSPNPFKVFKNKIKDDEILKMVSNKFSKEFEELNDLLVMIDKSTK